MHPVGENPPRTVHFPHLLRQTDRHPISYLPCFQCSNVPSSNVRRPTFHPPLFQYVPRYGTPCPLFPMFRETHGSAVPGGKATPQYCFYIFQHPENTNILGSLSEKTGLCGKNSQVADPLPPQFGNFHVFTVFFAIL